MAERVRWIVARLLVAAGVLLGLGAVTVGGVVAWLEAGRTPGPERSVIDVTELVRIDVERVVRPTSIEELVAVIAAHDGPVSIGGGRFSQGGQIATEDTLFLDLRGMDDVLDLDPEDKTIRVEAGATWRDVLEATTPHGLAPAIMQSYADFTVGGSLSVNAHGRYVNQGPLVHSVRAFDLVLADGFRVRCSRVDHADLFWAAVGGYGAIGVIAAVELSLADNLPVERVVDRMTLEDVPAFFEREVQGSEDAVFFNADLYPPTFEEAVSIQWVRTAREPTVPNLLQEGGESSALEKAMYWWVSEAPLGKAARREIIDELRLASAPVVWRSYEASYDVRGLDPGSKARSTYVLQEYFVPVDALVPFARDMAKVFSEHDVNVVNVSIRHASAEPESLLSWAPEETFAFVVYHKMGTGPVAWEHAGRWTRAMADVLLEHGGRWYLPYQIHPTREQFLSAYPRAPELFEIKRRVDPDYTFRNRLWDAYLPVGRDGYGLPPRSAATEAELAERPTYARGEEQTFLTLPEWYVVYAADELGPFLAESPPSAFPYFAAIGQFWGLYREVWDATRGRYPFNAGYHLMIWVVGASFTAEYAAKGAYEHTMGRLFEAWHGDARTPEELAYAEMTSAYGAFTHHTPWFAFPFAAHRAGLWDLDGPWSVRRAERFAVIWTELTLKQLWAGVIRWGTGTVYGAEATTLEAWAWRPSGEDWTPPAGASVLASLGSRGEGEDVLVALPRYEPFTAAVRGWLASGGEVVSVGGATRIVLQVRVDAGWDGARLWGEELTRWPVLSQPGRERVTLVVPLRRLDEVLPELARAGVTPERLYDY